MVDTKHDAAPHLEEGQLTRPGDGSSRAMAPVITLEAVQNYVETERSRSRRALLWTSTIFLFVVLLILTMFVSVGLLILRNSRETTEVVDDLQAQTAVYASEVVGISNTLSRLESSGTRIRDVLERQSAETSREDRMMKTELARFSRWIAEQKSEEAEAVRELKARIESLQASAEQSREALASVRQDYEALRRTVATRPETGMYTNPPGRPVPPAADVETVEQVQAPVPPDTQTVEQAEGPVAAVEAPEQDLGESGPIDMAAPPPMLEWTNAVSRADFDVDVPIPAPGRRDITVVTFPNGDRYEGEFEHGLFNGWGVYTYSNGDRYEGEFKNDMKWGRGTLTYRDGDKYIGEFKNDMKHGRGSYLFHNGDRYVGEFRNDMMNGKGTMLYRNGNQYTGNFRNGLRHGNGAFRFSNGDIYKGEFRDDLRDGRGIYIFSNGAKYIGEFKAGKRHGKGRYIYPGGEEYVGGFLKGRRHGEGVCIYPDGQQIKGVWKADKFVKPLDS